MMNKAELIVSIICAVAIFAGAWIAANVVHIEFVPVKSEYRNVK